MKKLCYLLIGFVFSFIITLTIIAQFTAPASESVTDPNDDLILTFEFEADANSIYVTFTETEKTKFCYIDSSGKTVFEIYMKELAGWSDEELIRFATYLSLAKSHCWNHPNEQKALEEIALRMLPERLFCGEKE